MAANKKINIPSVALTTALTTNILNPAVTSMGGPVGVTIAQPYLLIRHIRVSNKTGSAATFSLWKGATGANAAGTEFMGTAQSVAANSYVDWFGELRLDAADFLVGGAGTTTALTISFDNAEVGIA
jgi:hypothetical protein